MLFYSATPYVIEQIFNLYEKVRLEKIARNVKNVRAVFTREAIEIHLFEHMMDITLILRRQYDITVQDIAMTSLCTFGRDPDTDNTEVDTKALSAKHACMNEQRKILAFDASKVPTFKPSINSDSVNKKKR